MFPIDRDRDIRELDIMLGDRTRNACCDDHNPRVVRYVESVLPGESEGGRLSLGTIKITKDGSLLVGAPGEEPRPTY